MKVSGREVADVIAKKLRKQVIKLKVKPTLAIILAGHDPSSRMYVDFKIKKAIEIGVGIKYFEFQENQFQKCTQIIDRLNADKTVHGIIIQYPIFDSWDFDKVFSLVNPKKDVDGFHVDSPFSGATALGVWEMLNEFVRLEGFSSLEKFLRNKKIVLLGKGKTAGGPVRQLLQKKQVQFYLIDSKTPNPEEIIKEADVIISATGKKNIITGEKIKKGSFVIGVGVGKEDGRIYGDIEESSVSEKAKLYCPTIGGIGPLTIVNLLKNTIDAAGML
ncbi:MAG: bifunctional 5,10-methylenetetrahydrofolate dehydrogenase/5,10-methenyltetrahydrofolate cyclohydrolase [Candidatus Daviesbacteria bacterium]|nr:bifunctional 5,10-methylenetetrahydrofolate dehydrogenase/5,10-methenyltetrahydrofolate cyclohydrolase [Candidatus Daviesbacteria bacterium]